MAIIVEIKSKRNKCIGCAKEPTLRELQEGILGDLGSGIMNMISGKGTGFTKAIATKIRAYVVDAILQSLFDVAKNPDVRDLIIFKTFKETLASIDLEDIKQIYTDKRSWCAEIAENLLVALLRVTTSEVEKEVSYFASQKADQLAGSKIGSLLGGLAKLGTSSTEFLAKMALEDFKSSGAFEQITDAICSIKFTDVIKQVPGVGSIVGAFSEE